MDSKEKFGVLRVAMTALEEGNFKEASLMAKCVLDMEPDVTAFEILKLAITEKVASRLAASRIAQTPVDSFIEQTFLHSNWGHFHSSYEMWVQRRVQKLFQIYGIEFQGKRVLELGSGIGSIGSVLCDLGADVVGLEGRTTNCNIAKLRFRKLKNYGIVQWDLEQDFRHFGRFDLIVNFGLVEVISHFEQLLACCMDMSDYTILETLVCDSTDPHKVFYVDMSSEHHSDWPLSGKSPRPSPAYIERLFAERGFEVHRHFDSDVNTHTHTYDWQHENDGKTHGGLRRFWSFCKE